MSSSEEEANSKQDNHKEQQPESESTTTNKDETKSKNSTKKAQHFDFETLFQKTIHDQQIRNAERQATFTDANSEEKHVEGGFTTLPGGDRRDSKVLYLKNNRFFILSFIFRLMETVLTMSK